MLQPSGTHGFTAANYAKPQGNSWKPVGNHPKFCNFEKKRWGSPLGAALATVNLITESPKIESSIPLHRMIAVPRKLRFQVPGIFWCIYFQHFKSLTPGNFYFPVNGCILGEKIPMFRLGNSHARDGAERVSHSPPRAAASRREPPRAGGGSPLPLQSELNQAGLPPNALNRPGSD